MIFRIRGVLTPKVSGAIHRWSLGDVEAWCNRYGIVKITVLHAAVKPKFYQPVSALGLPCFENISQWSTRKRADGLSRP